VRRQLLRRGITDFVILEKAGGVGGTWRDNTYPGAACDIPSHLYSYSFAPNPAWSRAYGGQPEILAYLEQCADRFGLRPHLRFHAQVERAAYDEANATWTVHVPGAPALTARALILGNGALHLPAFPAIAGRDRFAGAAFHSARWDHAYPLDGKQVAVIGTGASTIQFLPEIAKRAGHVTVFQRTPPWIVPKADRTITRAEQWLFARVPGAHWLRRTGLYWLLEARVLGFAFSPKLNQLFARVVRPDARTIARLARRSTERRAGVSRRDRRSARRHGVDLGLSELVHGARRRCVVVAGVHVRLLAAHAPRRSRQLRGARARRAGARRRTATHSYLGAPPISDDTVTVARR
jgi:cation diffusion facilitator CzcD-associated flavoprotein CzcO